MTEHEEAVRRSLCTFRLQPADVDDALQETYLRVLKREKRRGESIRPGMAAPFLKAVARNVAIDRSQTRRWAALVVEPAAPDVPDPATPAVPDLAILSPDLRAVVECLHIDGLTQRQAARVLGIARNTVRLRNQRALKILRRLAA